MTLRGGVGHRTWVVVRHVGLTPRPAELTRAAACLSPAELAYAGRGTEEVRIRRTLLRAALRELLGELLGVPARDVPLSTRPGRPALDPRAGRPAFDLSSSASGDIGLVAIARGGRVGVDVQRIADEDPDAAVAEGWLSDEERHRIVALPIAARPAALTWAWAQKEAVLKGQGIGLRTDMTTVRSVAGETGRIGRWRISAIQAPPGYVACAAVRPTGLTGRLGSRRPFVV
jgi:4'-phosphopantetheinyl transferase